MNREHHVKIGELKRGRHGESLRTTLGSCLGIAILWPAEGRFALAHCLLGHAPPEAGHAGAKYVSHAIPNLLRLLRARPEDFGALKIVVAGGASMMGKIAPARAVGAANIKAAEALLVTFKPGQVHWDVGGDQATEIAIDCSTGNFQIRRVAKHGNEEEYAAS
ncbi:MAG: hypothetical protein EOP11_05715 [Proteobacteria bacterium]|nr:MAG: hypothetical protein EOP11_05715 [Pseudomonadota bacterium]